MAGIGRARNALTEAILAVGEEPAGGCREIYRESEPLPRSEWLTELVHEVRCTARVPWPHAASARG